MQPAFLVPESSVYANGQGPTVELSPPTPESILVTLGITKTVEQEFLQLSIHGSSDGTNWQPVPLTAFPQKFYPGVSAILLDLKAHPDVSYLRAQWKVNRWGRGDKTPNFRFYVFAEPL
jgi:hypothetical protein